MIFSLKIIIILKISYKQHKKGKDITSYSNKVKACATRLFFDRKRVFEMNNEKSYMHVRSTTEIGDYTKPAE